mmetsp:Transcript_23656/g.45045  ORF Transcript_23656/g.45045 Transcript_23656/m.45045 type:complete len:274 (-) Transcript_23656:71-892(-)
MGTCTMRLVAPRGAMGVPFAARSWTLRRSTIRLSLALRRPSALAAVMSPAYPRSASVSSGLQIGDSRARVVAARAVATRPSGTCAASALRLVVSVGLVESSRDEVADFVADSAASTSMPLDLSVVDTALPALSAPSLSTGVAVLTTSSAAFLTTGVAFSTYGFARSTAPLATSPATLAFLDTSSTTPAAALSLSCSSAASSEAVTARAGEETRGEASAAPAASVAFLPAPSWYEATTSRRAGWRECARLAFKNEAPVLTTVDAARLVYAAMVK